MHLERSDPTDALGGDCLNLVGCLNHSRVLQKGLPGRFHGQGTVWGVLSEEIDQNFDGLRVAAKPSAK